MPPMHEIAHLAHVELRTPVPERSLEFFTGYLGLTATGSAGNSVFLRAWDDYEQTTIKLTAHATSGVGRTSLRAASPRLPGRRGGS
jgi:catechol 2,3-dioxygenase